MTPIPGTGQKERDDWYSMSSRLVQGSDPGKITLSRHAPTVTVEKPGTVLRDLGFSQPLELISVSENEQT